MIAIDVMGGDFAPHIVLQGAVQAAREGNEVLLFGPEALMIEALDKDFSGWRSLPVQLAHASESIGMHEEAVGAVRKKQDSSLVRAIASVARGDAQAVVSAGHSGALMVASVFVLGRQEGVERPAIAGLFPARGKFVIGLDLGANTDCKPHHLIQFAQLGIEYARSMLGLERPRLALLANGEEDVKGSMLTKEVFQLLKQDPGFNFIGNREPHDVLGGDVDIFVCDGFTGNIFLKTFEAVYAERTAAFYKCIDAEAFLDHATREKIKENFAVSDFVEKIGGALLVGVKGPVFVCHGAAQAHDITQAIRTAARYVESMKNNKSVAI